MGIAKDTPGLLETLEYLASGIPAELSASDIQDVEEAVEIVWQVLPYGDRLVRLPQGAFSEWAWLNALSG
ncbi:MAG: hypothetical protein WCV84_04095 [Patescibacteria group bacterium]